MNIIIKEIETKDMDAYGQWNLPHHLHHDFNGPYYDRETVEKLDKKIERMKNNLEEGKPAREGMMAIVDKECDELIGTVSKYYKSKETDWMEIGIVVFNDNYWGQGIGYKALKLWIDLVFKMHPEFVRLGLTTWSGNLGMVKLSEKLGLRQEACYRKARIVNNEYYDSVSYGILRKEWFDKK